MNKFTDAFETLRDSFLESLRIRSQAPATLLCRSQSLSTFFLWLAEQGIDDVREITCEHIRNYKLWLHHPSKTSKPSAHYTTYTIHTKLCTVRRFFEYLETTDAILLNPCAGIVLPKLENRLPRSILTQEEARRLLDAPDTQTKKGIRDKAILELFYSTGIRREEMTSLTLHDVDTRSGFVRITKGKFAKDRVVPMGRKASDYLAEYITKVRYIWSQHQKDERALWLSSLSPHQPMKKYAIGNMIKIYKKLVGIQCPGSIHLWRHTCATHMLQNGANIAYVQRLLGHRSLDTTQVYTRVAVPEVKTTLFKRHPRARTKAKTATTQPGKMKGAYGK